MSDKDANRVRDLLPPVLLPSTRLPPLALPLARLPVRVRRLRLRLQLRRRRLPGQVAKIMSWHLHLQQLFAYTKCATKRRSRRSRMTTMGIPFS